MLDTRVLSKDLLLYVPLYLEMLYESPVMRGGGEGGVGVEVGGDDLCPLVLELIPYETVVKELEADTISTSAGMGYHGRRFCPGRFSQAAFLDIKVSCHMMVM